MPDDEIRERLRRIERRQRQEQERIHRVLERLAPPEPITGFGARAKQQHWHRTKDAEERRLKAKGVPHDEAHARAVEHANANRLEDAS